MIYTELMFFPSIFFQRQYLVACFLVERLSLVPRLLFAASESSVY